MTPARLIASGLGSGFLPRAPGTWGSLAGLAIGAALLSAGPAALAGGALAAAALALWSIPRAAGIGLWPRRKADQADPGWIVIDEIAGQCVALLGLHRPGWLGLALGFALFRVFDIAKPGPVGWADRLGGAFGILADDLLAGAAAAILLALIV